MIDQDASQRRAWAETTWSGVFNGRGQDDAARHARNQLVVRYHEAVHRYFLAKLHDPHAASELYSNFALKLIESDRLIRNADPARGRFRNYLKKALHHMVIDYYRKRAGKHCGRLDEEFAGQDDDDHDRDFDPIMQQEVLNQAWKALDACERQTGSRHYTILRCQSDNPDLDSRDLAERASRQTGKRYTTGGYRKALQRAREKFAVLLLEEVERWLEAPTLDALEEELIDQQLLIYCRSALHARRQAARFLT